MTGNGLSVLAARASVPLLGLPCIGAGYGGGLEPSRWHGTDGMGHGRHYYWVEWAVDISMRWLRKDEPQCSFASSHCSSIITTQIITP